MNTQNFTATSSQYLEEKPEPLTTSSLWFYTNFVTADEIMKGNVLEFLKGKCAYTWHVEMENLSLKCLWMFVLV